MSQFFSIIRQDLRAGLIASLLVLAHALLLTAIKAPQEARTDDLISALGILSALISITILLTTFTIFESLDTRLLSRWVFKRGISSSGTGTEEEHLKEEEEEEEEEEVLVFSKTWIELSLGITLLAAWAFYIPQARIIMQAFIAGRSTGLLLIQSSYIAGTSSLAFLQIHLMASIIYHGLRHGGLAEKTFWNGRTGWWLGMGTIRLSENLREIKQKV